MSVKLAAKLPKDTNENGLNAGEAAFLARPMDQVVVVAYLSTQKVTIDYDEGGRVPTVMVDAVEIIDNPDALAAVKAHFESAHFQRVNWAPALPTEPEAVDVEYPDCESCQHGFELHSVNEGCYGLDEREDACECSEYTARCTCSHLWAYHDVDTSACTIRGEIMPGVFECMCTQFKPFLTFEVDPDATEGGALTLVPGGAVVEAAGLVIDIVQALARNGASA